MPCLYGEGQRLLRQLCEMVSLLGMLFLTGTEDST